MQIGDEYIFISDSYIKIYNIASDEKFGWGYGKISFNRKNKKIVQDKWSKSGGFINNDDVDYFEKNKKLFQYFEVDDEDYGQIALLLLLL